MSLWVILKHNFLSSHIMLYLVKHFSEFNVKGVASAGADDDGLGETIVEGLLISLRVG